MFGRHQIRTQNARYNQSMSTRYSGLFKGKKSFSEAKCEVAKKWALANGYHGEVGGWIYRDGGQRAVTQGWASFYDIKRNEILDWVCTQLTGCLTFHNLTNTFSTYRPTIRNTEKDIRAWVLAQEYDAHMALRGDSRRAYRVKW